MKVLVAPDSFKGSADAACVARCIADGWRDVRPSDEVRTVPLADGGEGTLDVLAAVVPTARRHWVEVVGPDGVSHRAPWLQLDDATAVVELAAASGLPLLRRPEPLTAHTAGFGQLLVEAARHPGIRRVVATVGGSASTDGGTGALRALGATFLDADGKPLPLGGAALARLDRVERRELLPPPAEGVELLVDVTAPLLGPDGAARQFGPQKGAGPDDVEALEVALARLAQVLEAPVDTPGTGAAGGTAYGLMALWGARLVPGAVAVGELVGLPDALQWADLVVTGEGQLDEQSFTGKVVGHVSRCAGPRPVLGCVGRTTGTAAQRLSGCVSLTELAGSSESAMADPCRWLHQAGAQLAHRHAG